MSDFIPFRMSFVTERNTSFASVLGNNTQIYLKFQQFSLFYSGSTQTQRKVNNVFVVFWKKKKRSLLPTNCLLQNARAL